MKLMRWRVSVCRAVSSATSLALLTGSLFGASLNAVKAAVPPQNNTGIVQGTVTDEKGGFIVGAKVEITNTTTKFVGTAVTDANGTYRINNVPFNSYTVKVAADTFQPTESTIDVHSNVPQTLDLSLKVGVTNAGEITVTGGQEKVQEIDTDRDNTSTQLSGTLIQREVGSDPVRGLTNTIAKTPGVVKGEDGRTILRGQENPYLLVIDGIPISDNFNPVYSAGIDLRSAESIEISTGNIAAEFGNRLGAVISVNTPSMSSQPLNGSFSMSGGSFNAGEAGGTVGGHIGKLGFFVSASASVTDRYLDSVTVENFHNYGHLEREFTKFDYSPTPNDILRFSFNFGAAQYQVANRPFQQIAGQDQRVLLNDNSQNFSWQHIISDTTITSFAIYRRQYGSQLLSNTFATPAFATQDRRLENDGLLASISHTTAKHSLKTGIEITRFPVRENFDFAVTNPASFAPTFPNGQPNPVLQFTLGNPFIFNQRRVGNEQSVYAQDRWKPTTNLTIDGGLRFDNYDLLVHRNQLSPRLGVAYSVPQTKTAFRASIDRFFTPPRNENILLANSAQAAALSPLGNGAVKPILPETQTAFEIGAQQQVTQFTKLDISYFQRKINNLGDVDQFFDTSVVFPVAISQARTHGIEARIDTAEVYGFSGNASFTNDYAIGITPLTGGLFLNESAIATLTQPGQKFFLDHDERVSAQWEGKYNNQKSGFFASLSGRYDSGLPVDLAGPRSFYEAQGPLFGFTSQVLDQIDFDRGRVKPRTVWDFTAGIDLRRKERVSITTQIDVLNLTNRFYLYTFESIFSGTRLGSPRTVAGHLTFRFK